MKKILTTLVLAIAVVTSALANNEKVKQEVLDAFNSKFSKAQHVTWETGYTYYKAAFNYYGNWMTAWYTTSGKFISVTRNMSSTELPLYLRNSLKNNYSGYWITDVVEESNKNGFSYYITLEDADNKFVLKSRSGGDWTLYSKQQKL